MYQTVTYAVRRLAAACAIGCHATRDAPTAGPSITTTPPSVDVTQPTQHNHDNVGGNKVLRETHTSHTLVHSVGRTAPPRVCTHTVRTSTPTAPLVLPLSDSVLTFFSTVPTCQVEGTAWWADACLVVSRLCQPVKTVYCDTTTQENGHGGAGGASPTVNLDPRFNGTWKLVRSRCVGVDACQWVGVDSTFFSHLERYDTLP